MNDPKISICIPVYNSSAYLASAIESALNQNYKSFEVLIIDNCSTDNTNEIAEQFARNDQKIRYVVNETNVGMVRNWNRCIELARGEYIKFLFSDDLLTSKDNLQRLADVLDNHQNVTLACSFRTLIDQDSNLMKELGFTPTNCIVSGNRAIRSCLTAAKNFIGEPSNVMFRKRQASRGFLCNYSQLVDLEMWFHLLMQGDIWCEREPLSAFRIHPEQQTAKNVGELLHLEESLRLYDSYLHPSGLKLPKILEKALYFVQCYRVWKGYIRHKIFSHDQAKQIISRYITFNKFIALIPIYKIVNPIWKLVLSKRRHNPLKK